LLFLYDLTSAYQILSKRTHSRRSYDVISIFKDGGHSVGNLLPASVLVTALVQQCPNSYYYYYYNYDIKINLTYAK